MKGRPIVVPLLLGLGSAAPAFAADPSFPLQPAAALDRATFTHAAPVKARPSEAGVTRVRLSPALISAARDDLADFRVIDGSSHQWPFVLVPDAGRDDLALRVEAAQSESGKSHRRLVPPIAPAVLDGVTFRVDRDRFDRAFHLLGELPGGRTTYLLRGRLSRPPGGPAEIAVSFPRARVTALALVVDDGDEAPLPLAEARAQAPVAELRLVAPAGEYTLLAGDPETKAPRYEIAADRDRVLAAPAGDAEVGPPAPNPRHLPRLPRGEERDRIALWSVLAVAVGVLVVLSLRLSRRSSP